jgi:hypothetical protein
MTCRALGVIAGLGLVIGCSGKPVPEQPDSPDEVVLFSIDGRPVRPEAAEQVDGRAKAERLHGYPVLGRVAISDAGRQREVLAKVHEAIRGGPEQAARCFNPRHVVRVVKDGTTTDLVICFECWQYRVYHDGQEEAPKERTISPDAQPYFDTILTEAGVPLAPKE